MSVSQDIYIHEWGRLHIHTNVCRFCCVCECLLVLFVECVFEGGWGGFHVSAHMCECVWCIPPPPSPFSISPSVIDLWALGCIIFQFFAGKVPFRDGSEYLTFQKILSLDYTFPITFPPGAKDLVENLLVTDPGKRLGAEVCLCVHACVCVYIYMFIYMYTYMHM